MAGQNDVGQPQRGPGNATVLENLNDSAWAWAPYQPDAARPWDLRWAGHLYRRAAFGGTWAQLQQALADGPQATVDGLLHPKGEVAAFNQAYDQYEKRAADSGAAGAPQAWWLRRLMETPHPLLEQMTLFWHNHFALSNAHVNNPALLFHYLQLLRGQALDNYATLLTDIWQEPALFLSLGAQANRKARPSEPLARVLLEQYTLGPGQFSEADVREVARAFTGWFVSRQELKHVAREHDPGVKNVLGQSGPFEGTDVIRILLDQPATARLVVNKLYRWFISETTPPPETLVTPLAAAFAKDFDIARLVETMLRSNLFFSPAAYRQKIKSPAEYALGLIRGLGGAVGTLRLGTDLAALGQDLYAPPTVKGWAGHRYWINRFTLLNRAKLAAALLASSGPYEGKLDPAAAARRNGHSTPAAASQFLCELFFQADLPPAVRQAVLDTAATPGSGENAPERLHEAAGLMAALPEFHLA